MVLPTGLVTLALSALFAVTNAFPTAASHLGPSHHRRLAAASRRQSNTTTSLEARSAPNSGYVSMAYMGNWDIYARGFFVSDIPASRLTHLLYSFANIAADGTITLSDTWADGQITFAGDDTTAAGNNLFGNFKQLYLLKQQNRHLKVLLSIGGWTYAANFDPITTASWRTQFIKTAVQMVEDYGLDGLDIDMEYPVASNVADFYNLLAGLRTALDALSTQTGVSKFLLSIAVPAGPSNYDPLQAYLSQINAVVDYVNLMAYDYCGPGWQLTACDIANVNGATFNTATAAAWYISNGISASKLVMGSPIYGYAYGGTTGHDEAYSSTATPPGDFGSVGNYDYRDLPLGTSPVVTEDTTLIASWAYDSATQVLASYDTVNIAKKKAEWLMTQNLAGAMYWEVSGDKTDDADSLIYQFSSTFAGAGGMDTTCNHLVFPNSQYDNIKDGMGVEAATCDGSAGPTTASGSSSTSSSTTTTRSTSTTVTTPTTTSRSTTSTATGHSTTSTTTSHTTSHTTTSTTSTTTTHTSSATPTPTSSVTISSISDPVTAPPTANAKTASFVPCNWKASTSKKCKPLGVWSKTKTYKKGAKVQCNNQLYKANWEVTSKWWAANSNEPYPSSVYGAWSLVGSC